MKEATYYVNEKNSATRCQLCPRNCLIQKDKTGFCGVRKNINGTLYALSYAKVASIALDPIEKKPLYHFFPGARTLSTGTFGCNMRCLHCQNSSLSQSDIIETDTTLRECSPTRLIEYALAENCQIVVWTYNEPLISPEYIMDGAKLAHQQGLKTAVVTAGGINTQPIKELMTVIDAYRLDIKGFTPELYKKLTGFNFLPSVLKGALIAKEANKHIEIVTNIIPNWNDDDQQLTGIAQWIYDNLGAETPWHVTAYFPAFKMKEPPTPVSTLEKAIAIGKQAGLKHIYIGNVASHPAQNTHCPSCGALLIKRDGYTTRCSNLEQNRCLKCGLLLNNFING